MALRVGVTINGVFVVDETGKIVDKVLFPKDDIKKVCSLVSDPKAQMAELLSKHSSAVPSVLDPLEIAKQLGYAEKEYLDFSKKVGSALVKLQMRETLSRDYIIIQAVSCHDDLNATINTLATRLREWYGLHFPELSPEIQDHEEYARTVMLGKKENVGKFYELAKDSMGIPISEEDVGAIISLSKTIEQLFAQKAVVEGYLERLMDEIAPNLKSIAGSALGARLIAKAGSLKKLSSHSASTIQVMGAEKALFKHLITGATCPKHGIIFQHPAIAGVPKNKRGKVARALAAKLAIASRVDYYTHQQNSVIKEKLDKRLKDIGK